MRSYVTSFLVLLLACGSNDAKLEGGGPDPDGGNRGDGGPGGEFEDGGGGNKDGGGGETCDHVLNAVIRDFKPCIADATATTCKEQTGHLDFEHYTGEKVTKGIVGKDLGADKTPVWASRGIVDENRFATTDAAHFAQWYHDVPGVNRKMNEPIPLTKQANGHYVFESNAFYPVDKLPDQGDFKKGPPWGDNQQVTHNYLFTTEVHLSFVYRRGQVFRFDGDDDLWVFINKKLVLDLGGPHPEVADEVNLDTLRLTEGTTYSMDLFHAERHTHLSNFRVDTTIECFKPPIIN